MIDATPFSLSARGDVCRGDVILFTESVFGGSFRKPKFLGERRIAARIVNDGYGALTQQHTFSLLVVASDGIEALTPGTRTTRKGRNVYRNGVLRQAWDDEAAREAALADKHARGDVARAARAERRQVEDYR